jgi:hypothetical protein
MPDFVPFGRCRNFSHKSPLTCGHVNMCLCNLGYVYENTVVNSWQCVPVEPVLRDASGRGNLPLR